MTDGLAVSIDVSKDGSAIMLVGRKKNEQMKVINVFTNEDAKALYELLTTVKKGVLEK